MAVDECCGSVVFAEEAAIDVVEPVPGDKPVPAGGTCETLQREIYSGLQPGTLEQTHSDS